MSGVEKGKTKPVIMVKDLYKVYRIGENRVRALNGVSFSINRGEFCAIVGTSGSGKSTLLNMLAGLEKPTKGEIVIIGEHMERKNENQLVRFRREHIGFIFQSFNLMGTMNAVENVALPLTFQGVSKRERIKRAKKMVHMVGLDKYWDHRPNQMSGGQQQRVGVARALVMQPEIIFADEPTGNLDSKTSREVMELMQKIVRKKNQTLVMVTHDNYLAGFADRIIHIMDGKIVKVEENNNPQGILANSGGTGAEAGEAKDSGIAQGAAGSGNNGAVQEAAGAQDGMQGSGMNKNDQSDSSNAAVVSNISNTEQQTGRPPDTGG